MAAKLIEIGGKKWKPVESEKATAEHNFWLTGHYCRSGLDRIEPGEDEDLFKFAERFVTEAIASGKALLLLGGVLIESHVEPVEWTPEMAIETSKFFGACSDPKDKAKIVGEVAMTVAGFLRAELQRSKSSAISSLRESERESPAEGSVSSPESSA